MKTDWDGHIIELNSEESATYESDFALRLKVFEKAMRIFDETGSELTVVVCNQDGKQIDGITTNTYKPEPLPEDQAQAARGAPRLPGM